MTYLIDSNCLIDPYNKYYNPKFVFTLPFWNFIDKAIKNGTIVLLDKVYAEVTAGKRQEDDWLSNRVKNYRKIMVPVEQDDEAFQNWIMISNDVSSRVKQGELKRIAWTELFSNDNAADPWLIAYAKAHGNTIVSLETPAPLTKKHLKIPDLADKYDVSCIDLFHFLSALFVDKSLTSGFDSRLA